MDWLGKLIGFMMIYATLVPVSCLAWGAWRKRLEDGALLGIVAGPGVGIVVMGLAAGVWMLTR